MKRARARVEAIVDASIARARVDLPDKADIIQELEEARGAALSCWPPQTMAAVKATEMKAKIIGLVVDRHAIASGSPQEWQESDEEVLERLRERVGSRAVEKFQALVNEIRMIQSGEKDDDDDDDGEADGAGSEPPALPPR